MPQPMWSPGTGAKGSSALESGVTAVTLHPLLRRKRAWKSAKALLPSGRLST